MSEKPGRQLGPLGLAVIDNIKRIRAEQHLSVAALSRRLDEIGRPIAVLGLRRIESGVRRVDVDDLAALADAFSVPIEALMDQKVGERYRTQCLKWLLAEAEWNQGIRPIKPNFGTTLIGYPPALNVPPTEWVNAKDVS